MKGFQRVIQFEDLQKLGKTLRMCKYGSYQLR